MVKKKCDEKKKWRFTNSVKISLLESGKLTESVTILLAVSSLCELNGKILEQLLEESSLLLINNNSPTYRKFNSEYSEILDLFLCSDNLSSKIENFEVLYDDSMGSDHYPILVKLSVEKNKQLSISNSEESLKPNFAKADWNKFKRAIEDKASNTLLEKPIRTVEDLNVAKDLLVRAILDAY